MQQLRAHRSHEALSGPAVALVLLGLFALRAQAQPSALLAFGDSLTDTGNLFASSEGRVPRPSLYNCTGQFTTAPGTWAAQLQLVAAPGRPSIPLSKYVFAVSGSTACDANAALLQLPAYICPAALSGQVARLAQTVADSAQFLSQLASPKTLITTIWSGHNDLRVLNALLARNAPTAELLAFLSGVASCVGSSAAALLPQLVGIQGARARLWPGAPPQQQLLVLFTLFPAQFYPPVLPEQRADFVNALQVINGGIAQATQQLAAAAQASGSGVRVVLFDANTVLQQAFANAASLGFTDTTTSCITYNDPFDLLLGLPATSVCPDPSNYWFLDPIHPTGRVHSIVAAAFHDFLRAAGVLAGRTTGDVVTSEVEIRRSEE